MSSTARWTLAGFAVVVALVVALALLLRDAEPPRHRSDPGRAPAAVSPAELAELRSRADLPPCPNGVGSGPAPLRGVQVTCLADGSVVGAGQVVAGRAVLLNLWAYWCVPCRRELPAMAAYQQRAGATATVLTVHQDRDEAAALSLLADLGVRLPTLQDGDRTIAGALRVPNVMPTTVLLRPDGSVAAVLPRAFDDADEISAAVDQHLGVAR